MPLSLATSYLNGGERALQGILAPLLPVPFLGLLLLSFFLNLYFIVRLLRPSGPARLLAPGKLRWVFLANSYWLPALFWWVAAFASFPGYQRERGFAAYSETGFAGLLTLPIYLFAAWRATRGLRARRISRDTWALQYCVLLLAIWMACLLAFEGHVTGEFMVAGPGAAFRLVYALLHALVLIRLFPRLEPAEERIFAESARLLRGSYNRVGPKIARRLDRRILADLVYALLKPLEWIAWAAEQSMRPRAFSVSRDS